MKSKKIVHDMQREQEILSSTIRSDGQGEDPAVRALMSEEFAKMSNREAMQVALSLQQIIAGQASILENQKTLADATAKLAARMDRMDKAQEAYDRDQKKFIDDVMERTKHIRTDDPMKKASMEGDVRKQLGALIEQRQIRMQEEDRLFAFKIENDPKETVVSPGIMEVRVVNGIPTPTLLPDVLRIKHRQWVFPPGVPVEVPKFVADIFRERQVRREEGKERQQAVSAERKNWGNDGNEVKMARRLAEVDKKYGVSSAPIPLSSEE